MSALIGRSFLRQAQPSRSTWGLILGAEFRFLCISWGGCSDLTKAECCGRCSAKRDFSILFVGLLHFNILFGCYGLVLFCFLFVPGLGNGRCDTKDDGSWSFTGCFLSMAAAFGGQAIGHGKGQRFARLCSSKVMWCWVLGVPKPIYFKAFLRTYKQGKQVFTPDVFFLGVSNAKSQ